MLTSGIALSPSQKARESFTHSTISTKDKHTHNVHINLFYDITIVVARSILHGYSNDIYLELCAPLNKKCKNGSIGIAIYNIPMMMVSISMHVKSSKM